MADETLKSFVEKCAINCNCNAETNAANQALVLISKLAEEIDNRGGVGGGGGNFIVEVSEDGKTILTPVAEYKAAFREGKTVILSNIHTAWGRQYGLVMQSDIYSGCFCSVEPNYGNGKVDGILVSCAEAKADGTFTYKRYICQLMS